MSNLDELKRFKEDLHKSEELQNKLKEASTRICEANPSWSDDEILAAAAKELGYDISVAALEQDKAGAEVLDLDALEAVNGGVTDEHSYCKTGSNFICKYTYRCEKEDEYGHDALCYTAWHCATITCHTECEDQSVACWKDYTCFVVNKKAVIQ